MSWGLTCECDVGLTGKKGGDRGQFSPPQRLHTAASRPVSCPVSCPVSHPVSHQASHMALHPASYSGFTPGFTPGFTHGFTPGAHHVVILGFTKQLYSFTHTASHIRLHTHTASHNGLSLRLYLQRLHKEIKK